MAHAISLRGSQGPMRRERGMNRGGVCLTLRNGRTTLAPYLSRDILSLCEKNRARKGHGCGKGVGGEEGGKT